MARKDQEDPIGTYVEWSQHRLNPGHYLGGNIEPDLRKSALGPRARRRSGILLVTSGVLSMLLVPVYADASTLYGAVLGVLVSVLTLVAGVRMLREEGPARRRRKPPGTRDRK